MPILEVRNLSKRFDDTEVIKDISFSLEKGETLSIIGSSGSGKTTLLRCLNFLETPDTGTITVNGRSYSMLPIRYPERKRHTGKVPALRARFPVIQPLSPVHRSAERYPGRIAAAEGTPRLQCKEKRDTRGNNQQRESHP